MMMARNGNTPSADHALLPINLDDAAERSAKTALASKLNGLIDQRGLSQAAAATIIGMTQPKVSQIRHYRLQNISLERLMQALVALDQNVAIIVQPARRAHTAAITVAV